MKQVFVELTGLEVIFLVAAAVSLFFNLYQFMIAQRDKKALHNPLTNSLVALFNNIKGETNMVYVSQNGLFNAQNPHQKLETLKWEYWQLLQGIITSLSGFQEAVVGMLVTFNPADKTGDLAFRATDYGLTEFEKQGRKEFMERRSAQQAGTQQVAVQDKDASSSGDKAEGSERDRQT